MKWLILILFVGMTSEACGDGELDSQVGRDRLVRECIAPIKLSRPNYVVAAYDRFTDTTRVQVQSVLHGSYISMRAATDGKPGIFTKSAYLCPGQATCTPDSVYILATVVGSEPRVGAATEALFLFNGERRARHEILWTTQESDSFADNPIYSEEAALIAVDYDGFAEIACSDSVSVRLGSASHDLDYREVYRLRALLKVAEELTPYDSLDHSAQM